MRTIAIFLIFLFYPFLFWSQDIKTTLQSRSWYSDLTLVGNRDQTIIITDSITKPTDYEIKFLVNNDFYFAFINNDNMFDENGNIIPPGTKNEFDKFQYSIKNNTIKIFYKPKYLNPTQAGDGAYYYQISALTNDSTIEFKPIKKSDFR